ncbi:TIGR02206 family membrane protein [Mycolicibacterium flavescens]|uniref:TIGR02206 family membrane protein n=1 Tax=Mycolicibacterium flavescens TaxID=1776 RepID=A0A1E3RQ56_MYCFV|nr:TIGR02206 family membrane protein [Mycolicibacterium flavescens]MCV7279363.1 TIGR02206 family membrane protein [Mycolicibacterium flavescens]ODQ92023.1 hypothetical protein BHQ18_04055 [Mycolicibacterium flavescens]
MLARQFEPYGPSYWGALAVFVVGAALLVRAGRRMSHTSARRVGRTLGGVTAAIYAAIVVYNLVPPTLDSSVPLQLTDLATVVAAYALWTQRHWAYALTYYWGLVLSVQALISPVLRGPDFPHYQFLAFYAIHLVVVWAAIYLTWGRGMRPGWRDYRLAVVVTSAWAVVTVVFNRLADTNYGFTNRKPASASLLDLLGPWPAYIVVTAALVFAVWALMTWPWVRPERARR